MPIKITNKVKTYKKDIFNFVEFINSNNNIPDDILLTTFNTPFVFDSKNKPAFGVFYMDNYKKLRINIAIKIKELEQYKNIKFNRKDCVYIILETIAHEFLHYIQYKNNKKFTERGLDDRALCMIKCYLDTNKSVIDNKYITSSFIYIKL